MLELLADPVARDAAHRPRDLDRALPAAAHRQRQRELVHRDYLAHSDRVNNWDLVDLSAPTIVGRHLLDAGGDIGLLRRLAGSALVWDRRIAMVATMTFSRAGDPAPAFEIATLLLDDEHDLMHKACGWMLREAGKADEPRADRLRGGKRRRGWRERELRYAIERLPRGGAAAG